jgi:hypothetical protein
MHHWWQYATVAALSALKFMVGVGAGLALQLGFWEQFICTALGGVAGVVAYAFVGEGIGRAWAWARARFGKPKADSTQRDQNTGWARRVWNRFGLVGFALVAPPTLGPPIAVPLAVLLSAGARPAAARWRVVVAMSVAVVGWAAVLALSGREIIAWLQSWF